MPDVQVEIKGTEGAKKAMAAPKDKKQAVQEKKPVIQEKKVDPGVKSIVRIATTDIDGTLPVGAALRRITGVSFMFAHAICHSTKTDPKKILGTLNEKEIETIQSFILEQSKSPTLPGWMLNRKKDPETGSTGHIIGTNLTFRQREDINFMKRMRCRRGIRHELGLPVRGQHTRSTGRRGRGVGVMRKSAAAAAKPAAPAAPAKAAPAKTEAKK